MAYAFVFSVIGLIGMTFIIVDSKIASGFRRWWREHSGIEIGGHQMSEMIDCHQCAGFWVGAIGSPFLALWLPRLEYTFLAACILILPFVIISGCAISILSWFTRATIDWLQMNINISIDDLEQDDQEKIKSLGDQTSDTD